MAMWRSPGTVYLPNSLVGRAWDALPKYVTKDRSLVCGRVKWVRPIKAETMDWSVRIPKSQTMYDGGGPQTISTIPRPASEAKNPLGLPFNTTRTECHD